MREKYFVTSSAVGASRRILVLEVDRDAAFSEEELFGMNVAARGVDAYKSCRRVRPKAITGDVA